MKHKKLRDDLEARPLARSLGYAIEMNAADKQRGAAVDYTDDAQCPHHALSFKRGDKTIWFCRKGWACADLTGNGSSVAITYRNHRYYDNLTEALKKEAA